MLGKALATAVLLATTLAVAPQAQAGAAFSTTIVISSVPKVQIAHQGGYSRHKHWGMWRVHRSDVARHYWPGRHHVIHHHPRRHAAHPQRHWGGHHPRHRWAQATHRHHKFSHRARH